ncbi:hypothetical protein RJ641_032584 [Dillenia turbinata]|uniref:BAHD acyltransferase n=1 Tax=Dillenia turbinata TaxID=194707 RepID=A0AAN8ZIE3_9MAGN
MWNSFLRKGKFVTRRLVFAPSAIETLKTKGISLLVQNPSRVEAVSAFLWKCTMEASKKRHGYRRPSMLSHAVNLRRRTLPALPDNSIGNIIWMATAQCEMDTALDLPGLVAKASKGISKVNGEFTKRLLSNIGRDVICEFLQETCEFSSKDSIMYIGYTSWCKLGLYDIDFGWGKPIWVSSMGLSTSVFVNLIILMETSCGDGIEAWITLDEQEMAVLEGDPEILKFACFDLSPLDFNRADNGALYL